MKTPGPTISLSNYRGMFQDHDLYDEPIKIMNKFMDKHLLLNAFNSVADIVSLSLVFKCVFYAYRPRDDPKILNFILADDTMVMLSKAKFLSSINLRVPLNTSFKGPSNRDVFKALYRMCDPSKLKCIADFEKAKLLVVWQFVCHYLIRCLFSKTDDTDSMGKQFLDIL